MQAPPGQLGTLLKPATPKGIRSKGKPERRSPAQPSKDRLERLVSLAEGYEKRVKEETELTKDQLKTRYVGKLDPKKHLEDVGQQLIEDNIVAVSRQMIDKEATMAKKETPAGANGQKNGDQMEVEEEEL